MPRPATSSIKYKLLLPPGQLAALHTRAQTDEVPVAELLRRVADLAVTFGVPSRPVHLPYPDVDPEPFIFFIQQQMLDRLNTEAVRRDVGIDDLLNDALYVYLRRRELADAGMVA